MRSVPAGRRRIRTVRTTPQAMPTPAQSRAKSTLWFWKKCVTSSRDQAQCGNTCRIAARGFLSHVAGRGLGVGELQVRHRLLEITNQVRRDDVREHGHERLHRVDDELCLREVTIVLGLLRQT